MKKTVALLLIIIIAALVAAPALASDVTVAVTLKVTGSGSVTVGVPSGGKDSVSGGAVTAQTVTTEGTTSFSFLTTESDNAYTLSVSAIPLVNHTIKSITCNGSAVSGGTTSKLSDNAPYIEVVFEKSAISSFAITIPSVEGGSATASTQTAFEGDNINLTAKAAEGYKFVSWSTSTGLAVTSPSAELTSFVMPASDITVTPLFKKIYRLTFTQPTGATIVSKDASLVEGEEVEIELVPSSGYEMSMWISSSGGSFLNATSAKTTFIMPGNDVTVSATLKATEPVATPTPEKGDSGGAASDESYLIAVSVPNGGGSINLSQNKAKAGGTITVKAVPDSGYSFKGWSASGGIFENADSESTVFTMPAAAVTITAVFSSSSGGLVWLFVLLGVLAALAAVFFILRALRPQLITSLLRKLKFMFKKKGGRGRGGKNSIPEALDEPGGEEPRLENMPPIDSQPDYQAPSSTQQNARFTSQQNALRRGVNDTNAAPPAGGRAPQYPGSYTGQTGYRAAAGQPRAPMPQNRGDAYNTAQRQRPPYGPSYPTASQDGLMGSNDTTVFLTRPINGVARPPQQMAQRQPSVPQRMPQPRPLTEPIAPSAQAARPRGAQTQPFPAQKAAKPRANAPEISDSDAELLGRDVKQDPFYENQDRDFFDF